MTIRSTDAGTQWTRHPGTGGRRPDLLVVLASFNTITAWAAGRADTSVLGLLAEALGRPRHLTRIITIPFVGADLAGHPAYPHALAVLADAGVELIDPLTNSPARPGGTSPISSGLGEATAAAFDPTSIIRTAHP